MKALVIGGTGFLGGAIAEYALHKGFRVDVLTRQKLRSNNGMLNYIQGDRYEGNPFKNDNSYDVVFDTCGFEPGAVNNLLDSLNLEVLNKYVFISSASVYGDYTVPKLSEVASLKGASDGDLELAKNLLADNRTSAEAYGESYGPLKRECELHAIKRLGNKAVILRSGLLVGAGDYTDRLTWWVRRVDKAGTVVCPLPTNRNIQLIDVRDAAKFAVHSVLKDLSGIFNLTGLKISFHELLIVIKKTSASEAGFEWVDLNSFLNIGLTPWTDLPLVLPNSPQFEHFFDIDVSKSIGSGLEFINIEETIKNILDWDRKSRDRQLKCGFDEKAEEKLRKIMCSDD